MSEKIIIYSASYCPYCDRAKDLLSRKGAIFKVIDVTDDFAMREVMMKESGGRKTVPQIFINGQHIGGFDDLHALDKEGKLNPLLSQ